MRIHRNAVRVSLFVGLALLASHLARAGDSYGPTTQVLTIGAAEFRSVDPVGMPGIQEVDLDGYLRNYQTSLVGFNVYSAPVRLPTGALVTTMCLYYYDAHPSANSVSVELDAQRLAPAGQEAGRLSITPILYSSFGGGYGVTCQDLSPAFTIRDVADVNGDGTQEIVGYYLNVRLRKLEDAFASLGGVRLFWQRQSSPAPFAQTFNDVPSSDSAFAFIEALAASGISAGCGGGNYCPDAPLTRRQMAVFLAKALGLHWAN